MPAALACSLAFFVAACATATTPTGDRVPAGPWGGVGIQLAVTASGATTEFDCAHGTIDQPLDRDREGRFSAVGRYVSEHGGPIREGDPPDSHPARYQGQITGDTMTLTITLTDRQQEIGSFTLKRDQSARLRKCL